MLQQFPIRRGAAPVRTLFSRHYSAPRTLPLTESVASAQLPSLAQEASELLAHCTPFVTLNFSHSSAQVGRNKHPSAACDSFTWTLQLKLLHSWTHERGTPSRPHHKHLPPEYVAVYLWETCRRPHHQLGTHNCQSQTRDECDAWRGEERGTGAVCGDEGACAADSFQCCAGLPPILRESKVDCGMSVKCESLVALLYPKWNECHSDVVGQTVADYKFGYDNEQRLFGGGCCCHGSCYRFMWHRLWPAISDLSNSWQRRFCGFGASGCLNVGRGSARRETLAPLWRFIQLWECKKFHERPHTTLFTFQAPNAKYFVWKHCAHFKLFNAKSTRKRRFFQTLGRLCC